MEFAKTLGNGPTGGLPSHEGGEQTPPKGFSIRVESPDLIFKAAKDGISGELGKLLLAKPLMSAAIKLQGGKQNFNLEANVGLDPHSAWNNSSLRMGQYKESVAKKLVPYKERGGNYIITGPRGTPLIISGETRLNVIHITTDTDEGKQILSTPQATLETFNIVLNDVADVLAATVEEVYGMADVLVPDEELVLRPPKVEANGKDRNRGMGKPFGEIDTPADLEGRIEIEKPSVRFEDIGGQEEAKREVEGIAFALKNPDLYKKWGTKPPKGIILYGPPGTGKTLMAKALASQANARFFHVQASDVASKWYGESEKIVKNIFDLAARTGEKTIIFFDEIDAVAPQREGSHEATQKTVGTLLENMDGMASNDNIMIVASTNRLESVDSALLRAGRFDRWVEVPLPDEEGRKQILGIHMKKAEKIASRVLFDQINVDTIASSMENSSGADISEIIRRVLEEKVRQEGMGRQPGDVSTDDILKEIKGYEKIRETKKKLGFSIPPQGANLQQKEAS